MIKTASNSGVHVALIAGDQYCPSAPLAECVFFVEDAEIRSFSSLTATLCLAQTLCIALGYRRDQQSPLTQSL